MNEKDSANTDPSGTTTAQHVYIYKCSRKQGSFLYLPARGNFEALPQSLLELLGDLSFSFDFILTPARKLIQVDAKTVLQHIAETGYFLQLPPPSNFNPQALMKQYLLVFNHSSKPLE